jgi:hypothetical protein
MFEVTRARLIRYGAIGTGVAVVIAVGVAAFIALQVPFQPPTSAPNSAPCSPRPCANMRGYILWVADLKSDAGVVSMQVSFQNSSNSTHADPADLNLVDSNKNASGPVFDPTGCTHWPRTEFNNGARLGPLPICFRPSSTSPPLTLRWSPDEGLFCCETDIVLG